MLFDGLISVPLRLYPPSSLWPVSINKEADRANNYNRLIDWLIDWL